MFLVLIPRITSSKINIKCVVTFRFYYHNKFYTLAAMVSQLSPYNPQLKKTAHDRHVVLYATINITIIQNKKCTKFYYIYRNIIKATISYMFRACVCVFWFKL